MFDPAVGVNACHAWIRSVKGVYTTIAAPSGANCIAAFHIALNNQVVGGFGSGGFTGTPFTYQNGTLTRLSLANVPFDAYITMSQSFGDGVNPAWPSLGQQPQRSTRRRWMGGLSDVGAATDPDPH